MQCQRSDVVMFWPKLCIMSPFQSMVASFVAENTFPGKVGRRQYLLWRHSSVTWPDPVNFFLPKAARRMPHKLCKISARSAQRFGATSPSPARARVNLSQYIVLLCNITARDAPACEQCQMSEFRWKISLTMIQMAFRPSRLWANVMPPHKLNSPPAFS